MKEDHGERNARGHLDTINEWHDALIAVRAGVAKTAEFLEFGGDEITEDALLEWARESALSVEVRSDWHAVGDKDAAATHYRVTLTTGGPALQLVGDLSEYGEPESARLEYCDWGSKWEELRVTETEKAALLEYARVFYFGD